MDKLSELLKEAKPLYKRRKRIKMCIMSLLILIIPTFTFCAYDVYNKGNDIYISLNNNVLQDELMFDSMNLLR